MSAGNFNSNGIGAALCSVMSFAPQAWKIIRTRETKDLSAPMYALTVTGFALWAGYGWVLGQWPIIVPNVTCCFLSLFILTMILLPRRRRTELANKLGGDT
jgi:MtN3 and saliva related transmembrane protein